MASRSNQKPILTNELLKSVIVACFGSLQYGYHMSELNAPQEALTCQLKLLNQYEDTFLGKYGFQQCIPLNNSQFGFITSIFSIGGLFGSLYAGQLADKYGRKKYSFLNSFLGFISSLILFSSNSYGQLIIGRFIAGIACGSAIVVTPVLINEISPQEWKGALGSMNQACINIGILIAQLLALFWANSLQWRWILFFGSIISLTNFILLFNIDESPKWLISRGEYFRAESILTNLRGGSRQDSRNEIDEWLGAQNNGYQHDSLVTIIAKQSNTTLNPLLVRPSTERSQMTNDTNNPNISKNISLWNYCTDSEFKLPRIAITIVLMSQQFCGINSIIFYGVKIIGELLPTYSIAINFSISILNVLITLIASILIDSWGRKPLLIISSTSMCVSTLFICMGIVQNNPVLLVISIFVYIGVFAIGLGPIPFLVISELSLPNTVGIAQSYGTTMNWIATFIVGVSFPILNDLIQGYVFAVFSAISALFAIYVWKLFPETKGKRGYYDVWSRWINCEDNVCLLP